MQKRAIIGLGAVCFVVVFALGFSLNASAEEGLIPSWIKTIAGFWANDQISDDEFVGALQFLVKEGILVIPSETQIDPPSLELDSGPSDTAIESSPVSQKLTPTLEAAWIQGFDSHRPSVLILVSLIDEQGNFVETSGDLTLTFVDEDDNELYNEKKYLTSDGFIEYTNEVSGETVTAIKYNIGTGKFRDTDWDYGWYQGYKEGEVKLAFEDTRKTLHTNQMLLTHLPLNEGFFSEDTGFIEFYETNEILNVGPFFIKVVGVGPYMSDINGITEEFFRVNLSTQYKQVSDVTFTIDEMYILDDKNNFIETEEDSFDELNKAILIDNGYILFKDMTKDPSEITIFLKITVLELDESDTSYADEAVITLR